VRRAGASFCDEDRLGFVSGFGYADGGMTWLRNLAGVRVATGRCGRVIEQQDSGDVGEHLYVVNADAQDVSAFDLDTSTGALTSVASSPSPAAPGAFSVAVTPAFMNLYVGTLDGRVTTFSVARGTGTLALLGTSQSGMVSVFALDRETGLASPEGNPLSTPFCPNGLAVEPSGRFLYVSSQDAYNGDLEGFSIDAKSGSLTPLEGSPFASFLAIAIAIAIAIDPSGKRLYVCDQQGWRRAYGVDIQTGALADLGFRAPTGENPFSIATDRVGQGLFVGKAMLALVTRSQVAQSCGSSVRPRRSPSGRLPDLGLAAPVATQAGAAATLAHRAAQPWSPRAGKCSDRLLRASQRCECVHRS
jgi:6-phosphogluconolactonase (cycloisomerase 2 family)